MKIDLLIKNGIVYDPLLKKDKKEDIYISNDLIVDKQEIDKSTEVIDAEGMHIIPGLVENHMHLFYTGTDSGLRPDLFLLPNGVTSAMDHGSSSANTFTFFKESVIDRSLVNIKAYLNVASGGIPTEGQFENIDPYFFDKIKIKYLFEKYKDTLLGLKIRICSDNEKDLDILPLQKTIELAQELNTTVTVHIKTPKLSYDKYAPLFRKGDTWIHMYYPKGNTIINPDTNEIYEEILQAQKHGVLFDVASGRSGFNFDLIRKAFNSGFKPNLLGTDLVTFNAYKRPMFSLLYTMSMYMALGYSFNEIVDLTVLNSAKQFKDESLATLQVNTKADIAIIDIKDKETIFNDCYGNSIIGNKLLVNKATIKDGKIVYRSIEI